MKRIALLAAAMICTSVWAYDPTEVKVTGHELPSELENVGVEERLGSRIDLDLPFTDDQGRVGPLRRFFHNDRPVVFAMVYYECPSLCNYHMNGLTDALKELKWTTGREFDVVAVSMDAEDNVESASRRKRLHAAAYGRVGAEEGWHFLFGSKENVKQLADQLGFKFKWLPERKQFAHAAVTYILTPEGKISRYLHGIQPDANTVKLSLLEASGGKIGNVIEQAMMFCFQFNPTKNKYTLYAWNLMRLGAAVMVLLLAILLIPVWRRERQTRV